jgi:hypothetical protein
MITAISYKKYVHTLKLLAVLLPDTQKSHSEASGQRTNPRVDGSKCPMMAASSVQHRRSRRVMLPKLTAYVNILAVSLQIQQKRRPTARLFIPATASAPHCDARDFCPTHRFQTE